MELTYQAIETPFNYRHRCWFCGEPSRRWVNFPSQQLIDLSHPPLTLPACDECLPVAKKSTVAHIFICRQQVKQYLGKRYQKHLAIGVQWTKEELENCGFKGKALEGFAQSGWQMFEIARDRINFTGWPLVVAGIELSPDECVDALAEAFLFDGMVYPSLAEAITHYALAFHMSRPVLVEAIGILGRQRFAKAVSFCRLQVGKSPAQINLALDKLRWEAQTCTSCQLV